jgi:hypothetical protein
MMFPFEWLIFMSASLNDAANNSDYVSSDNCVVNNESDPQEEESSCVCHLEYV